MRTVVKLLLLPALGVLCAGIVIAAGLLDFSAMKPPSHFEEELATFALNRSIKHHAPISSNPLAGEPGAAIAGLALFRTHCVACHGAPGVDPTEAGASLNPPAPGLTLPRIQKRPDGELFYIVSHGIKMTGMPSFTGARTDEEIWQLVVALRRLPKLTDEEKRALRTSQ
jgi:mono/diheme cytochrome c family protein